jgi:exosortase B
MRQATDSPPTGTAVRRVLPWLLLLAGFFAAYVPTALGLFSTVWRTEQNAHGPIVLAVGLWFLYFKARALAREGFISRARPAPRLGAALLLCGVATYILGRSQTVYMLEVGSSVLVLMALVLLFFGVRVLQRLWFGFFFLLFMIPLPGSMVDVITQPMKIAVSYAAEHLLYSLGYPVARSGVVLSLGQYQLLVADACAGLNSLFTLEALGLLYLNVMRHESALRNALLALLIVPISMSSNIIRVLILALVTFHFGDEAGQGFIHSFSGIVLFVTALLLTIGLDTLLRFGVARKKIRGVRP